MPKIKLKIDAEIDMPDNLIETLSKRNQMVMLTTVITTVKHDGDWKLLDVSLYENRNHLGEIKVDFADYYYEPF